MKPERWYNLNRGLSKKVLAELPCEPVAFDKRSQTAPSVLETDMDGKDVEAVVCVWIDSRPYVRGVRKAYFACETGEYLGDAFL